MGKENIDSDSTPVRPSALTGRDKGGWERVWVMALANLWKGAMVSLWYELMALRWHLAAVCTWSSLKCHCCKLPGGDGGRRWHTGWGSVGRVHVAPQWLPHQIRVTSSCGGGLHCLATVRLLWQWHIYLRQILDTLPLKMFLRLFAIWRYRWVLLCGLYWKIKAG